MNIFPLAVLQCVLLSGAQVCLKIGLARMEPFGWNLQFWKSFFINWQFALSGICFASGSCLWLYIIKHYPFSLAYPMTSMSYVFGMIAANIFFNEQIDPIKWLGIVLIITGCVFIAK